MSFSQAFLLDQAEQGNAKPTASENIARNLSALVENIVPHLAISPQLTRVSQSSTTFGLDVYSALLSGSYQERLREEMRKKVKVFEPRFIDFTIAETKIDSDRNAIMFDIEGRYRAQNSIQFLSTSTTLSLINRKARTENF